MRLDNFRITVNTLILWILLWGINSGALYADKKTQVLILGTTASSPYQEVVAGFKVGMGAMESIRYRELTQLSQMAFSQAIQQDRPDLILAVGGDALQIAQQQTSVPVISTLVLSTAEFKAGLTTGVALTFAYQTQLQWLKKILPDHSKVGVLYNPAENDKQVQTLRKLSEPLGLELLAIPVESPKQIPDALTQLMNTAQVILAIPDKIALSTATVKEVMLASFRNRVPLVGLSENWVKSGALYALTWDFNDLGQQSAEQAQKVLNGQLVRTMPPESPRKVNYAINTKIADHMNIQFSEQLIQKAKAVFN